MKIANVETILLESAASAGNEATWSGGTGAGWSAAFVRIEAGRFHGLGECYFGLFAPETIPPIVENLKPYLIAEDPLRIPYLIRKISHVTKFWNRHGLGRSVIGAVDLALYDLAGKILRLPVYQLLGGLAHLSVKTYASAGCTTSRDALLAEIRQAAEDGFLAYKWRVVNPDDAGPFMKSLRDETGKDFEIMADFVQGSAPQPWAKSAVIEAAEAIAPLRPAFIEEPFAIEDKRSHRELRARISSPVAAGEGISSLEETGQFIAEGAVDVLQPDVTIAGGFGICRSIGALAEANGISLASHNWGAVGSLMGNLHFSLSNPSSVYVEYPRIASPFREALLEAPLEMRGGRILPPKTCGLGIRIDAAAIDRYRYKGNAGHSFRWEEDLSSQELSAPSLTTGRAP